MFLPWLRHAAERDATLKNHIRRMESGFPRAPIEDDELRDSLIQEATRLATEMNNRQPGPCGISAGIGSQPYRFVTWTDAEIPFVNNLARAVDSENGTAGEKLCLLQILAAIVQTGGEGIVDVVATSANRWLRQSVPYFDPYSQQSGPLSSFTISLGGPELLERGLWWLGHAFLRRRPEAVRDVLTRRVLQEGPYVSSDVVDIAFAVMIQLALAAPVESTSTSMAIAGMSEALTTLAAPSDLGRSIRTFAGLLEGDDFGIARLGNNDVGRMLLECWTRRLPKIAKSPSAEVRVAAAQAAGLVATAC